METTYTVPTVKDLRKAGYKVFVKHCRLFKVSRLNYEKNRVDVTIESFFAIQGMEKKVCDSIFELLSKGGSTEIIVTDPKSGSEFSYTAVCSRHDNYCKKTGVELALKHIAGMMVVRDGQEGFEYKM